MAVSPQRLLSMDMTRLAVNENLLSVMRCRNKTPVTQTLFAPL